MIVLYRPGEGFYKSKLAASGWHARQESFTGNFQ
jgi:hypothetical protein